MTEVDDMEWQGFEGGELDEAVVKDNTLGDGKQERKRERKTKDSAAQSSKPDKNEIKSLSNGFSALQDLDNEEETSEGDVSAWLPLGLSGHTLAALAKLKFWHPTSIQVAAIPEILAGQDVIGKASTGSGKTLAFGLPIIESFVTSRAAITGNENGLKYPTALILSPTRELAHQIGQRIIQFCTNLTTESPRVAILTGGLAIQKQERLLAKADIVIGTPGRLWEIMSTIPGSLKRLQKIKFLVTDEADRLLSEGHFKEVEEILDALDKAEINGNETESKMSQPRQTLVFSATFQKELHRKLASRSKAANNVLDDKASLEYVLQKLNFRNEPKFIDVNPVRQMATNLREGLMECGAMEKDLYLYALLLQYPKSRTLVFTNSIASARRLTSLLQNLGLKPFVLHSEMPQKARLRSVERFADPATTSSILIATDVAARGLDIPSVDLIIHYHVPRAADTYIHRSGRTARGELSGTSILLCSPEETTPVQRLISKIHASSDQKSEMPPLCTLTLDRSLLHRLKPRVTLSTSIVSATSSKAKISSEESWLRKAADDLGVDYDSSDFAELESSAKGRGRGKGRKKATRNEATTTSKQQITAWRAELADLLAKRVNVGVSEKYLSAGGVDVEALLQEKEERSSGNRGGAEFLGRVDIIRGWE